MGMFGRRRRGSSDRSANREDLAQLREWASQRRGVEAFLEPQTSVTHTTLLLVAGDGEFTRRRIASAAAAGDFARKLGIPIYETNRVGTPQRMRDYAERMAQKSKAPATPPAHRWNAQALETLARAASMPVPAMPNDQSVRELWKTARARVHPDRNSGDRTAWDAVEDAATKLGLRR